MANAQRNTPALDVARSTQRILQTSSDVLWLLSDDDCTGLGANTALQRELNISGYVAEQICSALEHLGLLTRAGKRGRGAYYYVQSRQPKVSLRATQRLLKEFGSAPVLLRAV